ncbi:cytochrome P450 [Actinomadura napierensis]|uniref:Cytochrome P450 n=1 Tax=Actinomadura napierensis TaxID=267854 RepID=A0ABP5M9L4_9ACTN
MPTPDYPFPGGYEHCPGLDLPPEYLDLQRRCPVAPVTTVEGEDVILVTRMADVRRVLAQADTFSRQACTVKDDLREQAYLPDIDGPRHRAQRNMVRSSFTQQSAEQLRPRAIQITSDLLTAMERHTPPADLIQHLALPLPVTIISELLGIAAQDRSQFGDWATAFLGLRPGASDAELASASLAQRELYAYMEAQLAQRRRSPGTDLLSVLATADSPDPSIDVTEHERILLAIAVLVAGFETTTAMLANMTYLLLYRHPDWWKRLCSNPSQVPAAVEEMLRITPIDARDGMARAVTRDVDLAGVTIPAGSTVLVSKAAANRDPAAFTDPDRFNPDRPAAPGNITFGHGPHLCLGAHLARMELQVALSGLIRRFPALQAVTPEHEIAWKRSTMRGPEQLLVRWS